MRNGADTLIRDQSTVTFEGALKRSFRLWGIQQEVRELLLRLARKPNDLYFGHCLLRGLLGSGNDEVADRTALDFSSPADNNQRLRRYASFDPRCPASCVSHVSPPTNSVRHSTVHCQYFAYGQIVQASSEETNKQRRPKQRISEKRIQLRCSTMTPDRDYMLMKHKEETFEFSPQWVPSGPVPVCALLGRHIGCRENCSGARDAYKVFCAVH